MSSFTSIHSSATASPLPSGSNISQAIPTTTSSIDIEAVIQAATSSINSHLPPTRDTRTQLFVGNLPYRVRWQDLKDLFRKAGTVLRADVSLGPDNRSRGYGTVLLANTEDAARAIEMFNGFPWQTRTLEVRADRLPPDLDLSNPMNVIQFPKNHTSGPMMYPMTFIPPVNGAFVSDSSSPRLSNGHSSLSGISISPLNNPVNLISHGLISNGMGPGRNLFVGNLPFHCQWQDLKDLFRSAGQIVRADVALGPDGRSRGFGTVLFANDADAATAVAMFNGYEYNGRVLKVHHDKFSQSETSSQPVTPLGGPPTLPTQQQSIADPQIHTGHYVPLPQSPHFAFSSQPSSPFDPYPPHASRPQPQHEFTHSRGQPPPPILRHQQYLQHVQQSLPTLPKLLPPGRKNALTPTNDRVTAGPARVLSPASTTNVPNTIDHPVSRAPQPPIAGPRLSQATQTGNSRAPGTITLPSHQFTLPNPMSPHLTRGLPPMTPSMPGFTFHAPVSTPPLAHHFLSPGLGPFSPPITFFNPFLNPAPGAPIHVPSQQQQQQPASTRKAFDGSHISLDILTPQPQHSPQYFVPPAPASPRHDSNAFGYFPPLLSGSEPQDYFAGVEPPGSPLASDHRTVSSISAGTAVSSQNSSPRIDGKNISGSSRGTSIPADMDEQAKVTAFGPTLELLSSPMSLGLRAKSSSPAHGTPRILPPSVKRTMAAEPLLGGNSLRRASWTDTSGMRRAVAEMTLNKEN